MTNEEAIIDIRENIQPIIGGKSLDIAISAIEKQIPKKPENHSGIYYDNLCPSCGKRIKSGQGSSSRQRTNWCNHCGQAIDWSSEV